LWSVGELAAEPVMFSGHEGSVWSVAFSLDGTRLASGGSDGAIRLWSVDEPAAEPVVFSGHKSTVWSVVFSPDGTWLASGGRDGTVRLWRVSLEELARIGCQQVRRNLSQAEWQRYMPEGRPYRRTCPQPGQPVLAEVIEGGN
jgi:hypothetical protein